MPLIAAVAVATGWALYAVGHSPEQFRNDAATYWGFAVGLVTLAAAAIGWLWRRTRLKRDDKTRGAQQLADLADQLAETVKKEWENAASERKLLWPEPIPVRWRAPAAAMAGPVAAAVGSRQFQPLPGLRAVRAQDLQEGDIGDLHAVYGGLRSGRLVIAGAPGSGKSSAAVLLVVAALRYREQCSKEDRTNVPIPVMFTLHGWDPNTQKVDEWLVRQLQQAYPQLAGKRGVLDASALISSSKLSVILDGLDEIPRGLRPVALQELSEQATFRLLLLTRSDEMASAAQHELLEGAAVVELQEVEPTEAAAYLTLIQRDPPPNGWRQLVDQIRCDPSNALARALSNPLTLTLVRDTYRSQDDVRQLLDIANMGDGHTSDDDRAERVLECLLNRVLPAAYKQRLRNASGYNVQKAQVALSYIAARMNRERTNDLQWWRIASWAAATPRIIATGLIFWVLSAFVFWIAAGASVGIITGAADGAAVGFSIGLVALVTDLVVDGREARAPKRLARIRWRQVIGLPSAVGGVLVGLGVGVAGNLHPTENPNGAPLGVSGGSLVIAAVTAGVAAGLVFGLIRGISYPGAGNASPMTPLTSWRSDRTFSVVRGLVGGLVVGLAFALAFGLAFRLTWGLVAGPIYGLIGALLGGLVIGPVSSSTWAASLAFVELAVRWHTPIRLMRFLEDARERGVLRTVGPIYQFRHASLQDHLAEQAPGHSAGQALLRRVRSLIHRLIHPPMGPFTGQY